VTQVGNIIRLSFRDYTHEWRMSGCFVAALAAVLAPLMILFGLKFGIVTSMVTQLIENPINREIRPIGSGHYDQRWFERFRDLDEVEFVIPKTRALAATMQLKSQTAKRILTTELLATAEGDPLLTRLPKTPSDQFQIILSQGAAEKLNVKRDDRIDGSLARQFQGKRERVHLDLNVIDIADATVVSRNVAFVHLDLLLATEQFKDGRAVPSLGWDGSELDESSRSYPSFRLYARSIYDVEYLVRFSFSLGASLWANVDRKRKDLSVLRLLGFKSGKIVLFPVLQALYTAVLGWLLAVLVYLTFEQLINRFLAPKLNLDQTLCYLISEHFFWALGLTLGIAILAAIMGGMRAADIEPSDGLRDM